MMRLPTWARLRRRQPPPPPPEPTTPVGHAAALTAAASHVTLDAAAWRDWRFGDRAWQADAWRLYDITGPLRFVANWVGKSLSRCRLYVTELDEAGNPTVETEDPVIAALANVPFGSGPARTEALRLAGVDLFVSGECYVIGEAAGGTGGADAWWVVTGRQIKRRGDTITVSRPPKHGGGTLTYRPGQDIIWRVWSPHPNDTQEPDSPVRSAIPDLREIEVLRKREFAELDSRLAGAGLLLVPDTIDLPRAANDPPGAAGFTTLLTRTMATSLRDRADASAVVPIIVSGQPDALDKVRHVTFWSELSEQLLPLRKQAIDSLALSVDVPPEVLTGLGASNHWSAWEVSREAINIHITPVGDQLTDALTRAYLAPALEVIGYDPARYAYRLDTAPLETKANRGADGLAGYQAGLLSEDAARIAGAWGDADAPTPAERLRRLAERLFLTNPDAVLASPPLRAALGLPATATTTGGEPTGQPPAEPPVTQPPGRDIPTQPVPSQTSPPAAATAVARYAVRRALGVAGGRLVPHRQRDQWPGTPRHDLHTRSHPAGVDPTTIPRLLAGAWDDLPDALADTGIDPDTLTGILHDVATTCLTHARPYRDQLVDDALTARGHHTRARRPCPTR